MIRNMMRICNSDPLSTVRPGYRDKPAMKANIQELGFCYGSTYSLDGMRRWSA